MFQFKKKYPENRIAIITDNGEQFSYGDISHFSGTIQQVIKNRCLVFCLSGNTVGSVMGYVSFLSSSIVPVMLDAKINNGFLKSLINDYRPQYLWMPYGRLNEFEGYKVVFSKHNYTLVKLEEENYFQLHPDLAMLLTTSGSTGSPKFVRISYENLKVNTASIISYLSIDEKERAITTLPMWYSYGLSVINSHLSTGAALLLTSKTMVEKVFWDFFKSNEGSSLSGVPHTFNILKNIRFAQMELPSLRTITQAGGKLSDDLNKYISEYAFNSGKRFFVMYGQTEATARMSILPSDLIFEKFGSVGSPLQGSEFCLIDGNGREIEEADVIGELVYKGKNVSMGYAVSGNDLIKDDENNGVLLTGDLAKKDRDNFYYITGRKSRYIKLYGHRLNLDETEILLEQIISECACVGRDDKLSVYITDRSRLSEVKNYLSGKTGINSNAFSVEHCEEIPKNAFGKINYSILQKG